MFYYYNVIFLNFMELRRKCGIVYIIWGKKINFFFKLWEICYVLCNLFMFKWWEVFVNFLFKNFFIRYRKIIWWMWVLYKFYWVLFLIYKVVRNIFVKGILSCYLFFL